MSNSNAYNTGKIFDGYMGKNRIINGACNIAQRASLAVTSPTNGYGGPDRFFAANASTGSQFTQSQGAIVFGGVTKNAVVQTVNTVVGSLTSGSYWSGINQPIEGFNCFDLLGQAATISFIFSTNVTGTYSVALRDYSATNAFISTFSATSGIPTKVIIPVSTIPTSITTPNSSAGGMYLSIGSLNQGTYQSSTLNAWQSGNLFVSSTATNWGTVIGNFIAVTELQLEEGAIATPFERESISIVLQKCQRYYQVLTSFQTTGYSTTGGSVTTPAIILPTALRVAATSLVQSTTSQNNCTGLTLNPSSPSIIQTFVTGATASATFFAVTTIAAAAEL